MRVTNNGVGIHFEIFGEGPPVLLAHGFPDTGRLWEAQVTALTSAGYQVIVPDMRGYGASDKPEGIDAYNIAFIAGDLIAVLDDAGVEHAHVVGHDWGAAAAWVVASLFPDRVDRLVALSVGHPSSLFVTGSYEQFEKSWYMFFFQFEGVAEQWLSDDAWANFRGWSRHPDATRVIEELTAHGSLTPALNWYRANVPPASFVGPSLELPAIEASTMGVFGSADFALTEGQMTRSENQVAGSWRYERIEGAGHWLQLDAPDELNALLVDFLGS